MKSPLTPIDLSGITTYSITERQSKVNVSDFAKPWEKGGALSCFIDRLPGILAADDLQQIIAALARAHKTQKTIIIGMGAHVIKVGLNPILIDLMQRGIVSVIAMNGAGIIHDLEVALAGKTSEDVAASIGRGAFGMVRETAELLNRAIRQAAAANAGLGETVGRVILEEQLEFAGQSILATGARLGVPVTVHAAIGTDIIHMHPGFDAASLGKASHRDFRTFCAAVATLNEGVYINLGSAVILPEVFLKATTLVRNLGHDLENFTTVNMDFIQHYRPMTNVVRRPTAKGGRGFSLTGHHEIMFPLIAAGLIEVIASEESDPPNC